MSARIDLLCLIYIVRSVSFSMQVYYRLNNLGVKLFAIVFAVMYVYACLGMYLWNGKYNAGNEFEDINFNSFRNSMLLLFQLTTGSDWTSTWMHQIVDQLVATSHFKTYIMKINLIRVIQVWCFPAHNRWTTSTARWYSLPLSWFLWRWLYWIFYLR